MGKSRRFRKRPVVASCEPAIEFDVNTFLSSLPLPIQESIVQTLLNGSDISIISVGPWVELDAGDWGLFGSLNSKGEVLHISI